MSLNKTNELLNKLTTLPADFDIEKATDEDINNLVNQINENYKLRIINTPMEENNFFSSVKKEVITKTIAEHETELKSKLKKKFLLDDKEIENKDFDKILEYTASKVNQSADVRNQELILKLNSANTKIEDYEKTIIPNIKSKAESELKENKIDFKLKNILNGFKTDLTNQNLEFFYPGLKNLLNSKYNIDIDNNSDTLVIRGKNNDYVYENTRLLSNEDIILKELKEKDFIRKSNSGNNADMEKSILKGVESIVNNKKSNSFNKHAKELAAKKLAELRSAAISN